MGLNLGNAGANVGTVVNNAQNEMEEIVTYDIVAEKTKLAEKLVNSAEIDAIASTISVADLNTMVTFGADVAENISKASDAVLNSMSMDQIDKSSKLVLALNDVMKKFDIAEIQQEQTFFGKLFGNARKQLDKILDKYNTMGGEVDKIYVELKKYESEIKEANKVLQKMFDTNVGYFHELEKYILAGEQGCRELNDYIAQRQADFAASGDNEIQMELSGLEQARMLLEQRVHDLRIAENVAMQSVPMIRTMQFSNMNLVRKINSAFIITLPVFKQALAQAILLKRQKIQAEAMSVLDEKTNELLIKNAQNTVEQSKLTTQMTANSSIKMETLEKTWQTIVMGIDETQRIQDEARTKRVEDKKRLDEIRAEFDAKFVGK